MTTKLTHNVLFGPHAFPLAVFRPTESVYPITLHYFMRYFIWFVFALTFPIEPHKAYSPRMQTSDLKMILKREK